MNDYLANYAAGRDERDQSLVEAARVALKVNPTPRLIRFRVDQDGTPIEIPEELQQSLPLEEA